MLEGRKSHDGRGRWDIGVVERQHRAPPTEQPARLKADTGATAGHLHATRVGFQQLAVHHLGDQLGAVQPGAIIRIRDAFREDAGAKLEQRPVRQLDRFQAARPQLATDRATQVHLHGRSTLGTGLPLGRQSPTTRSTRPNTGSNGRMMPPRSALSQRGRNRRMAGLSAIGASRAGRF